MPQKKFFVNQNLSYKDMHMFHWSQQNRTGEFCISSHLYGAQ